MRIVAGKHKGRPLAAPKGRDTRPTSDRAREAIFNVLDHGMPHPGPGPGLNGARVADVFAGTGALGLEALSRGAEHCIFVESQRAALRTLRDNIQLLGEDAAATLVDKKAANIGAPPGGAVDYAFLDAPYNQGLSEPALQALAENGWLNDNCVILVEVAKAEALSPPPGFEVVKEKTYGAARAVFIIFHA